jgi:hypothetical protein
MRALTSVLQCPWVGNAVGVRNYRDFVGFVFSAASLSGFVGSSCVRGLIDHLLEGRQRVQESGGSPVLGPVVCIVLMLYCAVVFFTTLGLLVYHLCLIAKNQTTNEDLKKVYQNVRAATVLLSPACRCSLLISPNCLNCVGSRLRQGSLVPLTIAAVDTTQVRNLHDHGCLRNFRRFLCSARRRSVVATARTEQELEEMALVPRLPGSLDRNSIL